MKKRRGTADIRERFGFAVRGRREELGLAQEELAEEAAIRRTHLSDIEGGVRNVGISDIERLAAALGLAVSGLSQRAERVRGQGRGGSPAFCLPIGRRRLVLG